MSGSSASARSNAAATAGLSYALNRNWLISVSASYVPLRADAEIDTALVNGMHIKSEAKMKIDPVITSLLVNYRF